MAEHTLDLGLARDETLARLWRAAAQGLPIPTECFAHSPSSKFVHKLQHVAAWNNHGPTAVALCEQTPDDDDEQVKAWILAQAAFHGSVDAAAALIAAGINVHAEVDLGGGKALHWAVRGGHVSAVAFLINAKADIEFPGWIRDSPIHRLAKGGDAVVQTLLSAKVDVNRADRDGATPIHWAAKTGDAAIVLQLLHAKANVKATDHSGNTALHWGAGCASVVRVLLAAKVDVEAVNYWGRQAVHDAALGGQVRAVARLIKAKAAMHAVQDGSGRTALHLAVAAGKHVAVAAFLVAAKSDVNHVDHAGQTPLLTAVQNNAADDIVQLLVDAKARVEKSALVHAFGRVERYTYTRFGV